MDNLLELLDIVDDQDVVIGQDTKGNKFQKSLISRNVAIFIMDDNGKFIITKRSPLKKSFPNRYDISACGNVMAGENYLDAAKREVLEELGIKCELKMLDKIYNEFEENGKAIKYFTGIFIGKYAGEVTFNDELVELKRLTLEEISDLVRENPDQFTPGFVKGFNEVKGVIRYKYDRFKTW